MWNPFSKSFSSGFSRGGLSEYSIPTPPTGAKFFYQREHNGGLGAGTQIVYFETEAEMLAYADNDQKAYRRKWQLITIGVILAAVAAWWYFKRK